MKTISNEVLLRYIAYIDCGCNQVEAGKKLGVGNYGIKFALDFIRDTCELEINTARRGKSEPTLEMRNFYELAKAGITIQKQMMGLTNAN